jgi:hypothetical protein
MFPEGFRIACDISTINVTSQMRLLQQVLLSQARGAPAMSRSFTFHACLSPATKQTDVLRLCGISQLLDAALAGFNVTIMT